MCPSLLTRITTGILTGSHVGIRNTFLCGAFFVVSLCFPTWISHVSHRLPYPLSRQRQLDDGLNDTVEETQGTFGDKDKSDLGEDGNTEKRNVERLETEADDTLSESCLQQAEDGLHIIHDDDNASIDIVAVHGLAANPTYAWLWLPKNNPPNAHGYPDKPFNWLEQLLPADLSCRVMTFNYNSKWCFGAPQQKLSSISGNLLESLRNERKDRTRPLIFIGHSFGGNIIEQAIVSASRSESECTHIAESTVGVLFMGTPHRGSAAATWGRLIASLAPSGFVTEDRLLKDLERHTDILTDRLYNFTRWLFVESVPVVCFYEKLVTDYSSRVGIIGNILRPKKLVVPESSACIDGHQKIALEADHFKINKFYGPTDPSFRLVYPCIVRMARGAEDMLKRRQNPKDIPMDQSATSGELRRCLQQMRVTNPRDILSDIQRQKGKRVGHTCEWILQRKEFSGWGTDNDSGLLRIIGSPGIGKTMMSTYLVEVLRGKVGKSPDKAFAYFFYDDKIHHRRTPTAMLRSLVWQLLLQRNGLFRHVQPDFEKHEEERVFADLFENFSTLWRIFQDMLRDEQAGEVFILIDALDECEKSSREALLLGLKDLFQMLPTPGGKLKFVITYQPKILDIKCKLYDVGASLKMDSSEVNADLHDYIEEEVDKLARRKNYSDNLKDEAKKALRGQAEGTFLWVSFMLKELQSVPNYRVSDKLKDLPKGLDETYTRILNRNIPEETREEARFLLLIMVAAKYPLKRKEIAAIFALWKNGKVLQSQDLHDYRDICSSCASIIYTASNDNDATVNFCHQSVKDFLLQEINDRAWFHTYTDRANLLMFEMCWKYLGSDELDNGRLVIRREDNILFQADKKDLKRNFQQYPFLEYAFCSWKSHAIASYPVLQKEFQIDTVRAPILRDALLLRTAREGQLELLKLLYDNGADLNIKNEHHWTPLSLAARYGHGALVKLLLATDQIGIDSRRDYGASLSGATFYGHREIVELLLATGQINIRLKGAYGYSLSLAAIHNRREIVELLLARAKFDVDSKVRGGKTLLTLAAWSGSIEVVKLLLATGQVDVDSKDEIGQTPLFLSARCGHEETVKLLLATGQVDVGSMTRNHQTPLTSAAKNGHIKIVELLLATGQFDVSSMVWNRQIEGALELAAENDHGQIVKLLQDYKASHCE